MISSIISRLVILLFGTLYPAYASYKAVKTKNIKEYVKWMMYWIVFALFTCAETFTDVFLSWFPFYYEIKIVLVIWLLSPATKGSSILYRKFVHPMLSSKEQEIDEYISRAKQQSYKQVLDFGSKGVTVLMQTAIKGGGGIVSQLRKSYSLSDLSDPGNEIETTDGVLNLTDTSFLRKRNSPLRSASTSMYFGEIDIDRTSILQSIDDISSGYSSAEALHSGGNISPTEIEPPHSRPGRLQARPAISRTGSQSRPKIAKPVTRSMSGSKKTPVCSDDLSVNATLPRTSKRTTKKKTL